MTATIDDLLARAAVPTTSPAAFDVGAALRRLAADAAKAAAVPSEDMQRAAEAGQRLAVVSRWILNEPSAADHVDRLADNEPTSQVGEDQLDVEGAAVFACLLYLTNHPESAQFWWQLAAGAGYRPAAYCLHLHHLSLGEKREARHWRYQVTHTLTEGEKREDQTPDDVFLSRLEIIASYVRHNGSTANGPTGGLEMEIDRLAEDGANSCIIVRRPDRRLADHLADFTRR